MAKREPEADELRRLAFVYAIKGVEDSLNQNRAFNAHGERQALIDEQTKLLSAFRQYYAKSWPIRESPAVINRQG